MKKDVRYLVVIPVICLLFGGAYYIEHRAPANRQSETGSKIQKDESGDVSEKNTYKIRTWNLEYELLSCEKIEDVDIEKQTVYDAENFYEGKVDADYKEEQIDYDKLKEEAPELYEMWQHKKTYPEEEITRIYNDNLDALNRCTEYVHPKTQYYFVKCRITNTGGTKEESNISLDTFLSSEETDEIYLQETALCYFDKAVHVEGEDREHKFFWYPIEPGETLECVLGFAVKVEEKENERYYVGVQPDDPNVYIIDDMEVVCLNDLLKESEE